MPKPGNAGTYWQDGTGPFLMPGLNDRELLLWNYIDEHVAGVTYYVNTSGSDSNAGTSTGAAWQTVAKVNAQTFSPGDRILFQSGQTFGTTTLTASTSGAPTAPIKYGVYGVTVPDSGVRGTQNATITQGIVVNGNVDWVEFDSLTCSGGTVSNNPLTAGNNTPTLSSHGKITRCVFDNGATSSTGVVGVVIYGQDWVIEDCIVRNTGDNGMYLVGDRIHVRDCTIQNTGLNTGIASARHGIYAQNANSEIIGNRIYSSSTDGISLRYGNCTVNGNTIVGCSIGIAWFQYDLVAGMTHIEDNYIDVYSTAGIYVSPSDIGGNTAESFTIRGNALVKQNSTGVVGMDLNPTTGVYYVDGKDNKNLMATNPSFEGSTTGWVVTGGPVTTGATLTTQALGLAFIATAPKFSGDGGTSEGKVVTTATASEGAAQNLGSSLPFGNYCLVGWIRGNAGGETVTATAGTGSTGNKTRNYTLTTAWQQIVLPFQILDTGSVYAGVITQSATIRTFMLDNFKVVAV